MTDTSSPPPKRRRGGQPGNLNARKHGLTPRPKPPEYRIEKFTHVDLTAEIHILRQQLVRLNDAALQATSLAETVEISRIIAQTASALARLIRAQVIVFTADTADTSEQDEWFEGVGEILTEVRNELSAKPLNDPCFAPIRVDSTFSPNEPTLPSPPKSSLP